MNKLNQKVARLMEWPANKGGYSLVSPATNESDAGLVLDRIGALGWAVTSYVGPYPDRDSPVNRCCIMRQPGDAVLGGMISVIADTRPLAICEAFVQAMERWSK